MNEHLQTLQNILSELHPCQLITVSFNLRREDFEFSFRQRVARWYRPRPDSVVQPFGTVEDVVADFQQLNAQLKSFHLSCCGVQVSGASNSVLSLQYLIGEQQYFVALQGISFFQRA